MGHRVPAETGTFKLAGGGTQGTLRKRAPVTTDEISKANPYIQFFFYLGYAINRWAHVDREFFELFKFAVTTNDEVKAAILFYKKPSISERFDLIDSLMTVSLNERRLVQWKAIIKPFSHLRGFRNRLAHDPATGVVVLWGIVGKPHEAPPPVPEPWWELHIGDDFRIAKQLEARFKLGGVGGHRLKECRVKARAYDRSFLRELPRLLRQPVDTGEQHRLNCVRNADRRFARHDLPLLAVALQHAEFDQAAHDLLDEQRVAAGAIKDLIGERPGGARPVFAEQRRQQAASVGVADLRQPERGMAEPA